jgi:hypothetical protein
MAAPQWTWAWTWWGGIVAINVANLLIGAVIFYRSKAAAEGEYAKYRKWMRSFGAIYVLVALYRSIFISSYLDQLAWFDSPANSSLLIRTLAIFAEISWAALITLSLLQTNKEVPAAAGPRRSGFYGFLTTKTPYLFFLCLCVAQVFATSATITKLDILFAIEETLWGFAFLSILPLVIIQLRRVHALKDKQSIKELRLFRIFTIMMTIFCIGYSGYSLFYHLPIEYWPKAIAQLRMDTPLPAIRTGMQAVKDAFLVVHETKDLATWGGIGFVIWHSGYFSLCVWMVLFMMNGPRRRKTL